MHTKLFIPLALIISLGSIVEAQYQSNYEMGSGYGGGSGGEYGMGGYEDRPKVQLGLRLKIPAMKFELPRFSLPKITVSAKIKQPDRPRVINLPEINLDTTSSKSAQHGTSNNNYAQHDISNDSGYGSSNYLGTKYDGYQDHNNKNKEQTFSFSTHENEAGISYGPSNYVQHKTGHNNYHPKENHHSSYGSAMDQQMRQTAYSSSTNLQPSYEPLNLMLQESRQNNYDSFLEPHSPSPLPPYNNQGKTADLGFDAPYYVRPADKQEPIEAYGRYPIRAMAFHPSADGNSFHMPREEQEVVVSNRFRTRPH